MASRNPGSAPSPVVPPPLIFLLVFLTALVPAFFVPLQFLPIGWNRIPSLLLCLGGLVIFAAAAFAFRKGRTPISPYEPAKHLLTTGPFLRTRNPMYLAFAWMYLGFACWVASLWPVLAFPVLIYVINRAFIAREEAHLEERFGKAYRDYKARTRRWM
jgi:protein-S-isoprenylcysteine O-methyltransferase Ste14